MILSNFHWWRRFRGGKWGRVTGLVWGRRWVRMPIASAELPDEWHGREKWKLPLDWWNDRVWVPFYCRFAWFHLMRHERLTDVRGFIIVYQRRGEPHVQGYRIESSHWTPRGCRRAIGPTMFFDALCKKLGPEGRRQVVHGKVRTKADERAGK